MRILDLFRSPKVMPFPKLVPFSLLRKKTMEQYIVQPQKFVSTSTWPCYLPNLSVSCAYMVSGLPADEGNYHLILRLLVFIKNRPVLVSIFLVPFPRMMPFH